jgi:hypothetical protein
MVMKTVGLIFLLLLKYFLRKKEKKNYLDRTCKLINNRLQRKIK